MRRFAVKTIKDKDSLRLEWTYERKHYTLYPGLCDSKSNRVKAQQIALQIEADVENNCYDASLAKYKKITKVFPSLSPTELFDIWLAFKRGSWDVETFKIRNYLKADLTNFFKDTKDCLTEEDVLNFYCWLISKNLAAETFNRKLDVFNVAWEWLLESGYISANPWSDLPRQKCGKKGNPKPFNKAEITKIISTFEADKIYNHYAAFVKFLFGTGCRIGEAIGIRWQDIDLESGKIAIAEQITSHQRKAAKAGSAREFYLSSATLSLLLELKAIANPDADLIFLTKSGKPIDAHNFRERAWEATLERAGVPYRKPSNTRHTFCSHALEGGMNPVTVAAITGHDPKVLFDSYAGLINRPQAPEIF